MVGVFGSCGISFGETIGVYLRAIFNSVFLYPGQFRDIITNGEDWQYDILNITV